MYSNSLPTNPENSNGYQDGTCVCKSICGKVRKELGKPHIMLWKQFIDDIFVIWTGSASEFMNTINQIHHTIKFTYDVNEMELTFLDVTLYIQRQQIQPQSIWNPRHTYSHKTNKQTIIMSMQPRITPQPQLMP